MILLHTSDWHLGAVDGDRSLREDQEFFIDAIARIIKDEHVGAVLIAGDVYDRSVASAEAVRLYDTAMTRIVRDLGVPVCMIAGNHDSAERLSSCSELLSGVGLHIAGALSRTPQVVSFDDTEIFLLPWIAEDQVRLVYPEQKDAVTDLESAYRVVTDRYRAMFTPHKKHILIAHAYTVNAETSQSDHAAEVGFARQIGAGVFEGFDYVALGHIHKPQDITETVRYCGTPMPFSFGKEETQHKSVTLIDTETMGRRVIELPLLHRRTTLTDTLDRLLHPTCPEDVRNGYVRAYATDSYVGLEALSELRRVYPNLLEADGKHFENDSSSVTLTVEELEKLQTDPIEVFRHFCREELNESPDDRLTDLFRAAVAAVGEADV